MSLYSGNPKAGTIEEPPSEIAKAESRVQSRTNSLQHQAGAAALRWESPRHLPLPQHQIPPDAQRRSGTHYCHTGITTSAQRKAGVQHRNGDILEASSDFIVGVYILSVRRWAEVWMATERLSSGVGISFTCFTATGTSTVCKSLPQSPSQSHVSPIPVPAQSHLARSLKRGGGLTAALVWE